MNQVIVTRYGPGGPTEGQTRGYNKLLTALQCYEEILVAFEQHVCKKWKQALAEAKEPTWWQRNIYQMDKESLLLRGDEGYQALYWLFRAIERDTLVKQRRSTWIVMESIAFDRKVDVAQHYEAYDALRNTIRNGEVFLLDSDSCKFINTFNKRLTIFH